VDENEAYQCSMFDGKKCTPPPYDGQDLDACEIETTDGTVLDPPATGHYSTCGLKKTSGTTKGQDKDPVEFCHSCSATSDCSMVRSSCGDGVCEKERGENVYTCPSNVGGGDCAWVQGQGVTTADNGLRPCCTNDDCSNVEANCALGCDHDGVCEYNGICDEGDETSVTRRNLNKEQCSASSKGCSIEQCTVRKEGAIIIKEDFWSCPSDCPMLRPSCGDGVCEPSRGENAMTCAPDCDEDIGLDRPKTEAPPAFLPIVEVATADCTHDSDQSTVDEDENVFTWETSRVCDDPIDAYTKQGQNNRDYGCTECTWDTWDPKTGGGSNNLLGFDRSDGIDSHGGPADKRGNFIPCQDNCRSTFDSVMQVVKGSRENVECAGRGLCDHGTGQCNCFKGYGSSNGLPTWGNGKVQFDDTGTHVTTGGEGSRRDCGFVQAVQFA